MTQGGSATGPLTDRVLEYEHTMKHLVPMVRSPSDWGPLAEFIDVEKFGRVGPFLEQQNWAQYAEMLTQWASSIDSFETTVRRISELAPFVYFEIEERHCRGGAAKVVNSLTVFEFDDQARVRHLDVYLQQRTVAE